MKTSPAVAVLALLCSFFMAGPALADDLIEEIQNLPSDSQPISDWETQHADNSDVSYPNAFDSDHGRTGWFGKSWFDIDGNGCDTRNDVLARDLKDISYKDKKNCVVKSGVLDSDFYTGKRIDFKRGKESSQAVQIDHIIPLNYAYAHGAWNWDADTRLAFANDPENVIAVDGPANQAKSDSGPATSPTGRSESFNATSGRGWWPEKNQCEYAEKFAHVAIKYQLGLPDEDRNDLIDHLSACETKVHESDSSPTMKKDVNAAHEKTTVKVLAVFVFSAAVVFTRTRKRISR
ncbi:HNH endonuclease family protein [Actinomyces vulturis]|uniref:HNH endonuclease family protein n=1 Tax=Actinomyces vulturis TaxID=1857645 RepID=UPI00083467C6|nr:HNH endonuclease family protein [Actinomyces vulturis]